MLPELYHVPVVSNPHPIEVSVPGSKSITNRALLIAALAKGRSTLSGVLFSDDSRHFLQALKDLGFWVLVDEKEKTVTIDGLGGEIPKKEASIYVGSAGTAARFLTAFLGLSNGRYRIDASEQMKKRPMKELLLALIDMGANVEFLEEEYHFPFIIGCDEWKRQEVTVDVDKSSQFLSALLISSVLSQKEFTIHVSGSHGMAYVDMTVQMMKQFKGNGILHRNETIDPNTKLSYILDANLSYEAMDYAVEPDLSAACYFYAMSPILKVPSKVKGVTWDCMQGDIAFLKVLEKMGCKIYDMKGLPKQYQNDFSDDEGLVVIPTNELQGGCFDLSSFSDQALTLAAIAPFAKDKVVIEHVEHIRLQECDRIEAILHNLKTMGIRCTLEHGTITIYPGNVLPGKIETFDDHRVAMSFTIPGLITEGITIINPSCCRKTFENYYEVLEQQVVE